MLRSTDNNSKCCRIEYANNYESLIEGLTNPYCYNFGRMAKCFTRENFTKMHHVINEEYLNRK